MTNINKIHTMQEHHNISDLSGYKTPAKARYFIEYTGNNFEELQKACAFATQEKLPILTVAGGRNSLFAFEEYPGLVIYNNSQGYKLIKNSDKSPLSRGNQRGVFYLNQKPPGLRPPPLTGGLWATNSQFSFK